MQSYRVHLKLGENLLAYKTQTLKLSFSTLLLLYVETNLCSLRCFHQMTSYHSLISHLWCSVNVTDFFCRFWSKICQSAVNKNKSVINHMWSIESNWIQIEFGSFGCLIGWLWVAHWIINQIHVYNEISAYNWNLKKFCKEIQELLTALYNFGIRTWNEQRISQALNATVNTYYRWLS